MSSTPLKFDELKLERVGKTFMGTTALSDLTLSVRAGEFVALLGPSGCGKSTALNCLAGLLPLSEGKILIDGQRVDTLPPEKRDFGMVFQNYALFPHLSVEKNVLFGLEMRGVPKPQARQRAADALSLVQLQDHVKKLPSQLSGGQQQRVAIARAIVLEPRLVLMDEPLSNLDAKLRLGMRAEIRKLHQALGLTTIYVTHDQEEALSMADRLVVLRDGQVQQIGTPQEMHQRPKNPYVADFMGYRNILEVTVSSVSDDHVLVEGPGLRLNATPMQPVTVGENVLLAIRPDDLTATMDGAVCIDATVSLVEYQGRGFAVELKSVAGNTLHAHFDEAPAPNSAVALTVSPHRALVYSAGNPETEPLPATEPETMEKVE